MARRFHEAAVIDEKGKVIVKQIKFQNSHSGYCKFMDAVRKLNEPVEFAMEATGHYWLPLYYVIDMASDIFAVLRDNKPYNLT
ncbi:MAG: transposase [Selenomonadaceae bacterium]|nr:transposase [Selenomonadaceae bacterium]